MSEFKFGDRVGIPYGDYIFVMYDEPPGTVMVIAQDGDILYTNESALQKHAPPPNTVPVRIERTLSLDRKQFPADVLRDSVWSMCDNINADHLAGIWRVTLERLTPLPAAPAEVNATPEVSDEDR